MALSFTTSRLSVSEISREAARPALSNLLTRVPELLTPEVVENLPAYFHGIKSQVDALVWFERMVSESRLFVVKQRHVDSIIGFVFAYVGDGHDAHIGYLLGEAYWGQGLASELLRGFIEHVAKTEGWIKLIGGVDRRNQVSSTLLLKLGFVEQSGGKGEVVFYEYLLPYPLS